MFDPRHSQVDDGEADEHGDRERMANGPIGETGRCELEGDDRGEKGSENEGSAQPGAGPTAAERQPGPGR